MLGGHKGVWKRQWQEDAISYRNICLEEDPNKEFLPLGLLVPRSNSCSIHLEYEAVMFTMLPDKSRFEAG
jgi:hypothetical protein